MNTTRDKFLEYEESFSSELDEILEIIKRHENEFLTNDNFFAPDAKLNPDISKLFRAYQYFCLYTNEDVIIKLKKEFGNDEVFFKWFIRIDDVIEQFDSISRNGILIDKSFALYIIRGHLIIKFMYQFNLKFVNPTSPFDVNKEQIVELRNLADREYYRADNPSAKIGSSDIELKNYLINLNIGENLFESIDNYKALLKGNSDIAIKLLFDKCFYFEMKEINTSRFYRSLYGLFQVILKDHEFPDKNHFEKIYRYYSKTYLSFQSIHVKKLYNKVSGKAV